jgi:dCMP deaminase
MNAITQAAKHGVSLDGATAYVTNTPCTTCAKALVGAGIRKVVVFSDYHSTLAEKFFSEAGVELARLSMPGKEIEYDLAGYTSARKLEE